MTRVNKLTQEVSEKIAAGEVIERPSSVIKELVENSLDASSDDIRVHINKAGKELIRIIDNGHGIHPDDVELAFSRHATSKVSGINDLNKISTLGFRGEALASIAAVSRIELRTRQNNQKEGTKLIMDGGIIKEIGSTGCPVGTDISVKDLFFNTPARLKFLRKDASEIALIQDIVNKLALAHPNVRFSLFNNNNKLLNTSGRNDLFEVIANIYGYQTAKKMLYVEYDANDISLRGYISRPELTRSNRNYQTLYVNGRYVKSSFLSERIEKGYHTLLAKHRYPFAIIKMNIPQEKLDINVHPAKIHVRFSDQKYVGDVMTKAITNTLKREELIFQASPTKNVDFDSGSQIRISKAMYYDDNQYQKSTFTENDLKKPSSDKSTNIKKSYKRPNTYEKVESIQPKEKANFEDKNKTNTTNSTEIEADYMAREKIEENNNQSIVNEENSELLQEVIEAKVIGQIFATYWILEGNNEIFLIDQHAAHERVNYHKLMQTYNNDKIKSQQVIPYTIELDTAGVTVVTNNLDTLKKCGLEFELFGKNTLLVRAVPFAIRDVFDSKALYDLIDQIIEHPENTPDLESLEEMLISIACKKSVKANEKMSLVEFFSLLKSLLVTPNAFTCPHGRPTIIRMTKSNVEKLFYRIM
ncbi:DNA mismatch repair endonuclease MutL [Natranaerobius trueperi]|uniref:DNA mismatch repair protein MutL n=1 Tax=Natranaerobius trueperi TaxID=759412 RepID=A0A226BW10_9FIRM|nr:DNA mismatch repair endonuclease MutL [Natranaerobius trueperi]OWZ83091.1 DNA mismatch repair protein MutL [Natranaerobius trueperi]